DRAMPTAALAPKLIDMPAWLRHPAPAAPVQTVTTTPSAAFDDRLARSAHGARDGTQIARALARGRLVHRMLQSLPDIAPERRAAAARQFVERAGGEFSAPERKAFVAQVLALIDDPRFAPLFAPGSRAEVPIVGRIPRADRPTLAISGQIDRLVVTPDAILIADYKTNRPAPRRLDEVPPGYVAQLALYRHVLARLYPDRPVRAALIWTDTSAPMEIPQAALNAAFAQVTSA